MDTNNRNQHWSFLRIYICVVINYEIVSTFTTTSTLLETQPTTEYCENDCVNGQTVGQCPFNETTELTCDCTNGQPASYFQAGLNYIQGIETLKYFHGDLCEIIDLSIPEWTASPRTINFTWPTQPLIYGDYVFVYRKVYHLVEEDKVILGQPFHMLEGVAANNVARLTGLQSGHVEYVICVKNTSEADSILRSKNMASVDNSSIECVLVMTEYSVMWEYTVAAYVVIGLMGLVVLSLVVGKVYVDHFQGKKLSGGDSDKNKLVSEKFVSTKAKAKCEDIPARI